MFKFNFFHIGTTLPLAIHTKIEQRYNTLIYKRNKIDLPSICGLITEKMLHNIADNYSSDE